MTLYAIPYSFHIKHAELSAYTSHFSLGWHSSHARRHNLIWLLGVKAWPIPVGVWYINNIAKHIQSQAFCVPDILAL